MWFTDILKVLAHIARGYPSLVVVITALLVTDTLNPEWDHQHFLEPNCNAEDSNQEEGLASCLIEMYPVVFQQWSDETLLFGD